MSSFFKKWGYPMPFNPIVKPVIKKMNKTLFLQSVQNNVKIIQKCLTTGIINLDEFMFWEGKTANQVSFDTAMSKWADILGCTAVGALPVLEKTGADGYIWYDKAGGYFAEIESKVCGVNQEDLALGKRGALYYSTNLDNPKSKCSITSHFAGSFKADMSKSTLNSKNRDTFLVLFDRTENKLIGSYRIPGRKVVELLSERQERNYGVSLTLKLSAFQYDGEIWETSNWETEGFSNWENRIIQQTARYIQS
jgi:hypothetical protein